MQEDKTIMQFESMLPVDFNGTFPFSNPSDEDFVGTWGGKEYLFPAKSTVALIIVEHTPIEVQHIRKKIAYDLAVREWFKSKGYKMLADQEGKPGNRTFSGIHQAATYTVKDLEPYIKKCLDPLPVSELLAKKADKVELESIIHTKDDGSLNTEAIDQRTSLRKKALEA